MWEMEGSYCTWSMPTAAVMTRLGGVIPVRICSLRMKSRSSAAEISPR